MREPALRIAAALTAALSAEAAAAYEPPLPAPGPGVFVDYGPFVVFFGPDSDLLDGPATSILQSAAGFVRSRPAAPTVLVEGHSDAAGPAAANLALSCRRAAAVRARLIALGLSPERVVALGFGERRPLVPTADGAAEAQNRNVRLAFATAAAALPPGAIRCR